MGIVEEGIELARKGHIDSAIAKMMAGIDEYAAVHGRMPAEF